MNKIIFVLVTIIISSTYATDSLHFVVPNFKPFTYEQNDTIRGIGVDRVSIVLTSLDIPFTISLVPNYGRAVEETRRGRSDGFFLATQNSERDSIAHFSNQLFINRWCWFTLKNAELQVSDPTFKSSARIATPINSNTHKWLKHEGYNVKYPISDLSSAVALLTDGLVDAVFISEEVYKKQLMEQNVSLDLVNFAVESERPFGIYFSNKIIENNPRLLVDINNTIDSLHFSETQR